MKNPVSQLWRLIQVTWFILTRYLLIFFKYREVSEFFTVIYRIRLLSQGKLKKKKLIDMYPTLKHVPVKLYNNYYSREDAMNLVSIMTPEEQFTMASLVKQLKPKAIFEIGTYKGGGTLNLFQNSSRDCKITTIDRHNVETNDHEIEEMFLSPRVERIIQDTHAFNKADHFGKYDLVIVDGGHSYDDVVNDSALAYKLVRKGGAILWHDYEPNHPGVMKALEEHQLSADFTQLAGTAMVLHLY